MKRDFEHLYDLGNAKNHLNTCRGVNTGVGRVNPLLLKILFFLLKKMKKNCAFESILVTNSYERICYAPLLPDLEILAVDAPPALETELRPWTRVEHWKGNCQRNLIDSTMNKFNSFSTNHFSSKGQNLISKPNRTQLLQFFFCISSFSSLLAKISLFKLSQWSSKTIEMHRSSTLKRNVFTLFS